MDVNETLRQIRAILEDVSEPMPSHLAEALRACVSDLDEWLSRGGFLPDAWKRDNNV